MQLSNREKHEMMHKQDNAKPKTLTGKRNKTKNL